MQRQRADSRDVAHPDTPVSNPPIGQGMMSDRSRRIDAWRILTAARPDPEYWNLFDASRPPQAWQARGWLRRSTAMQAVATQARLANRRRIRDRGHFFCLASILTSRDLFGCSVQCVTQAGRTKPLDGHALRASGAVVADLGCGAISNSHVAETRPANLWHERSKGRSPAGQRIGIIYARSFKRRRWKLPGLDRTSVHFRPSRFIHPNGRFVPYFHPHVLSPFDSAQKGTQNDSEHTAPPPAWRSGRWPLTASVHGATRHSAPPRPVPPRHRKQPIQTWLMSLRKTVSFDH